MPSYYTWSLLGHEIMDQQVQMPTQRSNLESKRSRFLQVILNHQLIINKLFHIYDILYENIKTYKKNYNDPYFVISLS